MPKKEKKEWNCLFKLLSLFCLNKTKKNPIFYLKLINDLSMTHMNTCTLNVKGKRLDKLCHLKITNFKNISVYLISNLSHTNLQNIGKINNDIFCWLHKWHVSFLIISFPYPSWCSTYVTPCKQNRCPKTMWKKVKWYSNWIQISFFFNSLHNILSNTRHS